MKHYHHDRPNAHPAYRKVDISNYLDTEIVAVCKQSIEDVSGQILTDDEKAYISKIHGIVRFYEGRGGISDKQRDRLQEFLLRVGE